MPLNQTTTTNHSQLEDAFALVCGTAMMAFGLSLYSSAGLITGGTAGIATFICHMSGWGFGPVYFLINLPFLAFAIARFKGGYLIRMILGVALVSTLSISTSSFMAVSYLQPVYGALMGGILMGTGLLILFRHNTSLGGTTLLVQYLQDRRGHSAGRIQMVLDCSIIALATLYLPLDRLALSILGAVAMSSILVLNHKQGRYLGVS